jgi:hypothetical protein
MIMSLLLILVSFSLLCYGWYRSDQGDEGYQYMGICSASLLTVVSIGLIFYASIRLELSPGGKIMLLFGTFIGAGFVTLFRKMSIEGFSAVFPKNKSDAIFYTIFLFALIAILVITLMGAYRFYNR